MNNEHIKNLVVRLCVVTITLSNGACFEIVHNLKETGGNKSFEGEYKRWINKTKKFTMASFIMSVKSHQPDCIFLPKQEYDRITEGVAIPATKEEWEAENN